MKLLKGSWIQKILAVALALVTYGYAHHLLSAKDRERQVTDPSYKLIRLTAKKLAVKVRLASTPSEGYRIVSDKVVSSPTHVTVIGPQALLEEADSAETALIDISDSKKSITRSVPLENVAGIPLAGEAYRVDVTVPIEPVEPPASEKPAP